MTTGKRVDPFRSYNFRLEIGSIDRGGFQECSGLDSAQDPITYREGTDGPTDHKLPGKNTYSNISLKRGVTNDAQLWDWRKKAQDGDVERVNGSIHLTDDSGQVRVSWDFEDGWPTKWIGPSFKASANEVAIEQLEIAHEGIVRRTD